MKRLVRNLILFFLPFVVVFALFLVFDGYNYFGQGVKPLYTSRSVSSMRELIREKSTHIILGTSQMANLNTDYIEEVCGQRYNSLAFGGSTLNDSIEQFWYAVEHTELEEVVFGVNFYSLNPNHWADRFSGNIEKIESPLAFLSDFNTWHTAGYNLKNALQNAFASLLDRPDLSVFIDDPSSTTQDPQPPDNRLENGIRQNLADYATTIYQQCESYADPAPSLERLDEIIRYCQENDIRIRFVLPNCQSILWEWVIYPLGLDTYIEQYKDFLKSRAEVIDLEFYNDFARNETYFQDGLHLRLEQKLWMARVIFAGEETPYCVRTTPEEYLAAKEAGIDLNS